MTEKKVYKPNCCTGCTFANECFSDARIKCADYEIAIKEYYRGLSEGLEEGCVKARKLEKEIEELKEKIETYEIQYKLMFEAREKNEAQIEKMKCCGNCSKSCFVQDCEDIVNRCDCATSDSLLFKCGVWELAE